MAGVRHAFFGFPSLSDSSLYCTNSLLECPVHLDAVFQSMDAVLSRRWHLPGQIVCDGLSRRKAWGLLLSGLMAATTTILLELDPFFMQLPEI